MNNTSTVAVRNKDGVRNLSKININVISPVSIDMELFENTFNLGLISEFAYEEIKLYYSFPDKCTRELIKHTGDYMIENIRSFDSVQISRIRSFIEKDPYGFRKEFSPFFDKMREAIES